MDAFLDEQKHVSVKKEFVTLQKHFLVTAEQHLLQEQMQPVRLQGKTFVSAMIINKIIVCLTARSTFQ